MMTTRGSLAVKGSLASQRADSSIKQFYEYGVNGLFSPSNLRQRKILIKQLYDLKRKDEIMLYCKD